MRCPRSWATILLVSNDSANRQPAGLHLAAKGYDVVTAPSATERLRALHGLQVDAAAGDMSAQDFCGWLQQQSPDRNVPLLFLVSPTQRWLPDSIPLRIGRDGLVSKPLRPAELEEALRPLLGAGATATSRTLSAAGLSLIVAPLRWRARAAPSP